MKFLSAGLLLICMVLLGGCSDETDLFTGLSEQDSNEVVARLADQHIDARKRLEKTGVVVTVATSDMNRAVRVLNAAGLPRQSRASLGISSRKKGSFRPRSKSAPATSMPCLRNSKRRFRR